MSLAVKNVAGLSVTMVFAVVWAWHQQKRRRLRGIQRDFWDENRLSLSLSLRLRPLAPEDYERNFLTLLSQLTEVGSLTNDFFRERLSLLEADPQQTMLVVEDANPCRTSHICAAATLIVEPKFIHCGSCAGHIEDVVVDVALRSKGLGRLLIERLKAVAREKGCYKVIVECADHNIGFYKKCGFWEKEVMMALYFSRAGHQPLATVARKATEKLEGVLALSHRGLQLCMRPLQPSDFHRGYMELLNQMSRMPDDAILSYDMFLQRIEEIHAKQSMRSYMIVVENLETCKIVAATTLLLELKFIHAGGVVGHIEDVVVNSEYRGKGLGVLVVQWAVTAAKEAGAYKCILDCSEENVGFYERIGFERKGVCMASYF